MNEKTTIIRGLYHSDANGISYKSEVAFTPQRITVTATSQQSRRTVAFDPRTMLPVNERKEIYFPTPKGMVTHSVEHDIFEKVLSKEESNDGAAKPVLCYTTTASSVSKRSINKSQHFPSASHASMLSPVYEALDEAISQLPKGHLSSNFRRRFDETAARIGYTAHHEPTIGRNGSLGRERSTTPTSHTHR